MSSDPDGRATYRNALRHRDFRWMVAALTISQIGSWAYNVALAVFVWEQTGSAAWLGAATLVRFVPVMLFSAYGGVIADRYERTKVMAIGDLVAATWMTLLTMVALVDGPVALALAFTALTSLVATVHFPAVAAMTPEVVGEDDLAAGNALLSTIENASIVVGPAIGAGLLLIGPPSFAFGINAASFVLSAWCVTRITGRSRADVADGDETPNVVQQVRAGFSALRGSNTATLLVGASVLASFLYGMDTVLFVIMSDDMFGTGAEGYGYLMAGLGVGGVLAAGLVNRLSASPHLARIVALGLVTYAIPTGLLVLTDQAWLGFTAQVIRGAGWLVVDVLAITAMQRAVSPEVMARVFGVMMTLAVGGMAAGALVTPVLLDVTTLATVLVLYGAITPILLLPLYPRLTAIDRAAKDQLAVIEPRVRALRRLGIFAAASRTSLERLATGLEERHVAADEYVLREGDPADALYVLIDGEVSVIAKQHRTRGRRVATLEPLTYFGEIGLLEEIPRTASVRTLTECDLFRIDGDDFLEALNGFDSPSLLDGAARRLRRTAPSYEPKGELADVAS